MKKTLIFCLIIASYSLQAQTVDDHIRARVSLRIGGNTTTAATGISNAMPGSPSTTLITAKGVYDWFTGVVTFAGDVSGPYNNLVLANTAVTPGTYTNATVTFDAKGRATSASSGSAGTTYTAGSGIAISGGNEISNTAPDQTVTISGASGTYPNFTLPTKENVLTFGNGLTRTGDAVANDFFTGKAGGQTLYGGTAANDDLTIEGTVSATKTTSYVSIQPTGGSVGIGTASPASKLDVVGMVTIDNGASGDALRINNSGFINFGNVFRMRGVGGSFVIQDASFNNKAQFSTGGSAGFVLDGYFGFGTGSPSSTNRLHIKGQGATSSTNTLYVENSAATALLTVRDDGNFAVGTRFTVSTTGNATASNNIIAGAAVSATTAVYIASSSNLKSNGSGIIQLGDTPETGFNRLQFGGSTTSFPALKRNGTTIETVLANDSGFAATQSLYQRFGSGSPESVVTAPVGAVYHRTDGGANTSFYVKESGTGNTGWVAK